MQMLRWHGLHPGKNTLLSMLRICRQFPANANHSMYVSYHSNTYHLFSNTLGVSALLSPEACFNTVTKTAFYHPQTIAATPLLSWQDMETLVHVFIALRQHYCIVVLAGFPRWLKKKWKRRQSALSPTCIQTQWSVQGKDTQFSHSHGTENNWL